MRSLVGFHGAIPIRVPRRVRVAFRAQMVTLLLQFSHDRGKYRILFRTIHESIVKYTVRELLFRSSRRGLRVS